MKKNLQVLALTTLLISQIAEAQTYSLSGTFTRGLQTYEITTNHSTTYFIEDPKQLIRTLDINKKHTGFWASFPLCIEGQLSKKGSYGPNGKYSYKVVVDKICNA